MNAIKRWQQRRQWEKNYAAMLLKVGNIPAKRIEFHVNNLDEYLLRWLGFCRLETKAPESLIDNQLFLVVEAATKIAGKDVAAMGLAEQQAWQKYQQSIVALPKCRVDLIKESAEQAYLYFKEFVSIVQH
jgi:hypothetical protein